MIGFEKWNTQKLKNWTIFKSLPWQQWNLESLQKIIRCRKWRMGKFYKCCHGNICTVAMARIIAGISAKHNQLQKLELQDGKSSEILPWQQVYLESLQSIISCRNLKIGKFQKCCHGNICTVAMATAVIRIIKLPNGIWAVEHPES